MTSSKKMPRAVIEQTADTPDSARPHAGPDDVSSTSFQDATIGFFAGVGRRAWAYADAHPHAVLYGALGLVLAVLILWLGLWHTLVISIFVGVGVTVGQVKDKDGGVYRFLSRLFGGGR